MSPVINVHQRKGSQNESVSASELIAGNFWPQHCRLAESRSEWANPLAQAGRAQKIPIGWSFIRLRDQCKTDLPGMLSAVSKIGLQGVEFAGYHGRSAKELRTMLDDNSLWPAARTRLTKRCWRTNFKETVEFNRVIGNRFLIVPSMTAASKKEWLEKPSCSTKSPAS